MPIPIPIPVPNSNPNPNPNPNANPKPNQISPHEMDDDALLSRTAALGLVARVTFGRDASHEVRPHAGRSPRMARRCSGCSPAAAAVTLRARRLQPCMCICTATLQRI